ncbi:hypothetical protein B0T20DRAFT_497337 [Sordaria brevicollis]|uniref:F-box domain-containing protein n=1 Tax=Sordaria brevicollis TaxID=83679 RepID=A0AAE0PG35_SORBR|nr:hypothetical protein B0T20DRAFT_497337 [Sordaria brevicollis]
MTRDRRPPRGRKRRCPPRKTYAQAATRTYAQVISMSYSFSSMPFSHETLSSPPPLPLPTIDQMDLILEQARVIPLPSDPPRVVLLDLPTEVLLSVVECLVADAKGPENECSEWLVEVKLDHRRRMKHALETLAHLARTCRFMHKLVVPLLYEQAFRLDERDAGDRDDHRTYQLLEALNRSEQLADLVRVYRIPPTMRFARTLFKYMEFGGYGWPLLDDFDQKARSFRSLLTKYLPWFSKDPSEWPTPTPEPFMELGLLTDLVPVIILCHCRNIRRLEYLGIGGTAYSIASGMWDKLLDSCVEFPNLESANLVGYYSIWPLHRRGGFDPRGEVETWFTPIFEAFCFVNRAPNLKHLSLTGFSTDQQIGERVIPLLPPLHNLTTLELHYCAYLSEDDLRTVIEGCPNLASFKFMAEASPTTGRPTPSSPDFKFCGPAAVLRALRSRAEKLTKISLRYLTALDFFFRLNGGFDTKENLIRTVGHFPNLKILQISHDALEWHNSDGPQEQQLVRLVEGCPRLESLDITQIDIRKSQIRPQLEGLTRAVYQLKYTPLLKGIRISLNHNNWRHGFTRTSLGAHCHELFEQEHLRIYKARGIRLLIDWEDAYNNQGTFSSVHEGLRHAVTLHPCVAAVSGLRFEPAYKELENKDCDRHTIFNSAYQMTPNSSRFHLIHNATKVLYGVIPNGKGTERYVNERRRNNIMYRSYGPWYYAAHLDGKVFDGLEEVE